MVAQVLGGAGVPCESDVGEAHQEERGRLGRGRGWMTDDDLESQADTWVKTHGSDPPRLERNSSDPLNRGIPAAGGATFRRAVPTWEKTI